MPIYLYECDLCGLEYEDYQSTYTGSRDIFCPDDPGIKMHRNYHKEQAVIQADWPPGYNIGIDYHYKNKSDLMREIRRRGLYPQQHGGGVATAKPGLYGDEQYKSLMGYSKPVGDNT